MLCLFVFLNKNIAINHVLCPCNWYITFLLTYSSFYYWFQFSSFAMLYIDVNYFLFNVIKFLNFLDRYINVFHQIWKNLATIQLFLFFLWFFSLFSILFLTFWICCYSYTDVPDTFNFLISSHSLFFFFSLLQIRQLILIHQVYWLFLLPSLNMLFHFFSFIVLFN